MRLMLLYLLTAVIFLGLDAVMLVTVMRPLFAAHLQGVLLVDMRAGPAALFYAGYIAGLLALVSVPALKVRRPVQAALRGAVLGVMAYGTFEFTAYAILAPWALRMVITDTLWGTVLTGFAAWAGVVLTRRFRP